MQQTGEFTMGKNARHHVHVMLDGSRFEGTHETRRQIREPQTLIVTKTDSTGQQYEEWVKRCRIAHDELQRLDQEGLKKILGSEYNGIMEMNCIVTDEARRPAFLPPRTAPVANAPSAKQASSRAPVAASSMRLGSAHNEVIDLCGDSD